MSNPTIVLGRDLGPCTTEQDYIDWVDYVCTHIDAACGFEVDVDTSNPRDVQDDRVTDADDDQRATVLEAVGSLWDRGCAENFGRSAVQP